MFHITRILFGNKTFATVFNGSDTWYTEYVPILKCLPLQTDSPFYNWYLKIVIIELNSSLVAVGPVRCAPTDKLKHFFSSNNIFKMIRRPQHIQFKLCSGMSKERHLFECFSVFDSRWITADVILLTLNSDALVPGSCDCFENHSNRYLFNFNLITTYFMWHSFHSEMVR